MDIEGRQKTIAVIGTLDTKAEEVRFLLEEFKRSGARCLVIDIGILGEPGVRAAVTREEIAEKGGVSLSELKEKQDRSLGIRVASVGLLAVLQSLSKKGKVDVLLGLGGGQGSVIISSAYQQMPLGMPKVLVSTIACGTRPFNFLIKDTDMIVLNTVSDLMGLNSITESILRNAAAVANGLANAPSSEPVSKANRSDRENRRVALSVMGITSIAGERIAGGLRDLGYEIVPFHSTGGGGAAMEAMIREGYFIAVADLTLHELCSELLGGFSAGTQDRLTAACEMGIPQIIAPGGIDFIDFVVEKGHTFDAATQYVFHNERIVHVRCSEGQTVRIAREMAFRLNEARGEVVVMIPDMGFSNTSRKGKPLFNSDLNRLFVRELRGALKPHIEISTMDAHIEDEIFCNRFIEVLDGALKKQRRSKGD